MKQKVVIIIEDNFNEYERIKSVVCDTFNCPQELTKEDFNVEKKKSFINNLKISLLITRNSNAEYEEQKKAIEKLKNDLKFYCKGNEEPVYLIDYLLDGSSRGNDINGIRFKEKILNEMYPKIIIPVLFITSANYSPKVKIEEYVKKINDKTLCSFQTKPDKNDWGIVKENIINFINNAKSKPSSEVANKENSSYLTEEETNKI